MSRETTNKPRSYHAAIETVPAGRAKRLRLLLLIQLPPPVHGASLMNEYLTGAGWLDSQYDSSVIPLQFADSVGDIGRARLAKVTKLVGVWSALALACIARRPTIAYFTLAPTGLAFWRDLTFVALLKVFSVPTIFHIHGRGMAVGRALTLRRICYRWAFKKSVVILLSASLYRELENITPRQHCRIVPNGIPDICEHGSTTRLEGLTSYVQVLFLSTMVREKGIFDLLEATAILRDEGVAIEVTYVGPFVSTSARDEFFRSVSVLALEDHVRWEGPAYGDSRWEYLATANVFGFPSYYAAEAFPLAILEAMAAGLPVVAARTGAIPDIIDDGRTGIIVPQRDPKALADALRVLAGDATMRRRMGEAGRKKYLQEYKLEKYLDRMQGVFAECAGATLADGSKQGIGAG